MKKSSAIIFFVYFLSACGGGGGGGDAPSSNSYSANPLPSVSLNLSSNKGYVGDSITLSWSSSNATNCYASDAWVGTKGLSGSESFIVDATGTFNFTILCSGNGGSSDKSVSLTTFSYDKVADSVLGKTWDAEAFANITSNNISGYVNYVDYSGDSTTPLTVNAYEPSSTSGYEVGYSGVTSKGNNFSFDLTFNDWNTSTMNLYITDFPNDPALTLFTSIFSDADVYGVITNSSLFGINYVEAGIIEIDPTVGYLYTIPSVFGDFTEINDMPSSGVSSKAFNTLGYYYEASVETGNSYIDYIVTDGGGNLSFDYSNKTVSGSITYDDFFPYTSFKSGTAAYNLITTIPSQTIQLKDGIIAGNQFSANLSIGSLESGNLGEGIIQGHFYGPNAKEIGFTVILYDAIDTDNEFSMLAGAGIGRSP